MIVQRSPNVVSGRLCIRPRRVMSDLNEVEPASRTERHRWQRRHYLGRLVVIAVLVAVCFAGGSYAGVLGKDSRSEAGHSAGAARKVHLPGVGPDEEQE